ncbi:Cadherin-24 [Characodon lateralis]|uniref:Cadherin-24 n=1 Tax=Characodon lateralis TaxID=208331 RepID=A0ABU7DP00_9TELE|nr:Cadherin-24 [Characodon lateralis]
MRGRPVEETDGLIERGSKRELETEMKRNEGRQREWRGWEGEVVSPCLSSPAGTSIIQVTATDADDPTYGNSAKLVYTLVQGQQYFSVDPQTGILRTAVPDMDRETQDQFLVVLQAKDMGGHLGGLSGTTTVTVKLTDVNDNPPRFTQTFLLWHKLENTPSNSDLS